MFAHKMKLRYREREPSNISDVLSSKPNKILFARSLAVVYNLFLFPTVTGAPIHPFHWSMATRVRMKLAAHIMTTDMAFHF